VTVVSGSSKTFSFVPNSNKLVKSVKLDGVTVYTGSSKGVTVTYTVNTVVAPHTIVAVFA
jgi:hypothetical protein